MREQTLFMLFYIVFLSQVFLISFYFPRKVLSRVRHVSETYPPSQYPRLYPVSIDWVEKAQRIYWGMNLFALLVGLALVFIGVYSPSEEMLNWDSVSVLTIYLAVQFSPLVIAATAGFTYSFLMRKADSRTTRRAELRPRRLFDFVSPEMIGLAIFVYVAFVLLILYVRQFEYPWFGGLWNIFGVTALNLFFAAIIIRYLHGKKSDPYQAHEDRRRQVGHSARILVWASIVGTTFIALNVALHAFEMEKLIPISTSLYFQFVALISFRAIRIEEIDFEVYKEDPMVA